MEDDTWQPGTVARVQVEHEGGTAPFAVQLDRGDAVIAPADEERFIRPLGGLRFRVGDRVECHVEDDRWAAGMWSGSNPKPKPKPKPKPNPNQVESTLASIDPPPPPLDSGVGGALAGLSEARLPEAAAVEALAPELAALARGLAARLAALRDGLTAQRRQLREGYQASVAALQATHTAALQAAAAARREQAEAYLPYISPTSPLHLTYISPTCPLTSATLRKWSSVLYLV